MTNFRTIQDRARELRALAHRHRATGISVFGSVARSSATESSDVDVLVECGDEMSLFDLAALQSDLSELLDARVDVVSSRALKGAARERILREAIRL